MLTGGRKALDNVVSTINALSYSVVLNMLGVYKQKSRRTESRDLLSL